MPIEKRQRSPSVPFIGLIRATAAARQLYDRIGRAPLLPAEAAAIWGLAAKTGSGFQKIAALRGYGLIERADDAHRIQISDLAAIIFEKQEPEALQRAFAVAALSPEIIAEYAAKWSAGRPSDAVCIADFQIKHRFTAPAAKSFLQVFDEAMWFVAGGATGVVAAVAPAPSPSSSIRIGDFVRIPTDGDQYPGGRRVVWLADGGRYLYVEKTLARYPVQAITKIGASPSAPGPNSDAGQSVLFPGIELPDALGYVQKIVDAAGREWVPIVEASNLWFGAPLLARTKQAAAGLCDYGFAEQQGRGQWHRLRLTELGWRAITQAGSTAGVLAVQEGISRSRLIVHYARQWQDRRPATVPAIKQVQREQGFSRKQAERFLAVFDQCFQFLRIR